MMSLQSSMHSSQMKTDGPAISLRTSCWLFPQKEQYSSFSPPTLSDIPAFATLVPSNRLSNDRFGPVRQYLIHQAVRHRLGCRQEVITIRVFFNRFNLLAGVLREDLVQPSLEEQDF